MLYQFSKAVLYLPHRLMIRGPTPTTINVIKPFRSKATFSRNHLKQQEKVKERIPKLHLI